MDYQRRTIDHLTKYLVYNNLAPKEVLQSLHTSQLSRYRNKEPKEWSGYELALLSLKNVELLQDFNDSPVWLEMFKAYQKVTLVLTTILTSLKGFRKELKTNKEQVLNCIEDVKSQIGLSETLELFHLSKTTYHNWLVEIKSKCLDSPFQLCQKRFPHQLTIGEIDKMKELLINKEFFHWPISSLCFYALKKNILNISLASWYKYSRALGIRRPKPISRKKKRKLGIRATNPNEIWHTDITRVELSNGLKYQVYLLVDNYSRKILNWRIGEKVSGLTSTTMIKETFDKVFDQLKTSVMVLADGGPENKPNLLSESMREQHVKLLRKTALKDIDFSNSIVEAINKILKNSFLHHFEIKTFEELKRLIEQFVKDYNEIRPHCSLNGLTPDEAYTNQPIPTELYAKQKEVSRLARLAANRAKTCGNCL